MKITKSMVHRIYKPRASDSLKIQFTRPPTRALTWIELNPDPTNEDPFYLLRKNCRLKTSNYEFEVNENDEVIAFKMVVPKVVQKLIDTGKRIVK